MAETAQRRLAAIMFTDMVGYSALTQKNEALALELLEDHHKLLRPIFPAYGGKEIKTIGDAFLVEFGSALEATRCAIEVQKTLVQHNAVAAPKKRIQIRIGIHIGDVVHKGNDVLGDGVNIASRIEPLAKAGGICVSEDVARQIRNKIEEPVVQIGTNELKNIELSVEVYQIVLPWVEIKGAFAGSVSPAPAVIYPLWRRAIPWGLAALMAVVVAVALWNPLRGIPTGEKPVTQLVGVPSEFDEDEIGILIAEIPGDTNRRQQNAYADAILRVIANTPDLDNRVRVSFLEQPLPRNPERQHEAALSIGRNLRATLVIRPIPTEGAHSPWVTIVDQPEFADQETPLGKITQGQLSELEEMPLPQNIMLLARCALALSYYGRIDYQKAVDQLTQILAIPELPAGAPERSHLNLLLGNSYTFLQSADPAFILPLAIAAYEKALHGWNQDRFPTEWAKTMHNLGNAYGGLPGPDRVANLREAIRSYDLALEVRTRERYPLDWAMTMNNRGATYVELPGPDRSADLREAIRSYDLALEVYTRENYPTDWAMATSNRGEAFLELSSPDQVANLQEAIRNFEEAIAVWEVHGIYGISDHADEDARRNLSRARRELAELTTGTP